MNEKQPSKSKKPGNIYDVFVKQIFGQIMVFADFLFHYADPKFVSEIELEKIYPAPTHYIGLKGDERISDLIFFCPLKYGNGSTKAVIVFEHIGSSLKKLPIKLHAYASAIWTEEIKNGQKVLSAIYFIVLRTGKKKFRGTYTTMADWLPKNREGKPIGIVLDIKYDVIDLPAFEMDKLRGGPTLRFGIGLLKKMTEEGAEEAEFVNWHEALLPIAEIADENQQSTLLKDGFEFMAKVFAVRGRRLEKEAVHKALDPIFRKEEQTMIKTIFEETFDEGFAAGEAKGKVQGVAIGEARGVAIGEARGGQNLVLAILRKRFTRVPKRIEAAIRNMSDPIALESLAIGAATSQTMNEFAEALN